MTMHTKDLLARELRKAGLELMAHSAERGRYHDFLSPLAAPALQLLNDLLREARASLTDSRREAIQSLITRHLDGAFDASLEESDQWAASPEGKAAFDEIAGRGH